MSGKPGRSGGVRPNARRPKEIEEPVDIHITLPTTDRDSIDALVGKRGRSAWIRQAIREKLDRGQAS